ncbi:something about silencing protein 10-like [Pollicipes pollicipes]|uniref:something about silencing protein 10-like n=1 Tax=Pollicipes pollicipes TaxID=41117 RepID=UPI0018859877|nr:something about silencing protein 10-like [Pollicipes pollicipes]
MAELEEREARAIQRRLAQQLEEHELEFGLATVQQPAPEAASAHTETVPLDTSRLSRAEKLDLLKKQHPELLPLIEEFRSRWTELAAVVNPIYRLVQEGKVSGGAGAAYVTAKHRLLLVYCLNISFYLGLRAAGRPTATHPVMRRIAQYGKLLQALGPADEAMEAHMARVSQQLADGVELQAAAVLPSAADQKTKPSAAKRLRLSKRRPTVETDTAPSGVDQKLAALTMEIDALEKEKKRVAEAKEAAGPTFTELRQAGQARHNPLTPFRKKDRPGQQYQTDAPDQEATKRSITYEMAKNKGLMPKRSKESRNPRVKHKEKFKRALKKRRSLVRQLCRSELQRYGGEVFGIRMGAVKSVPIR